MKILNLLLFLTFSLFFGSCDVSKSATVDSQYSATVQPTVNVNENTKQKVDAGSNETNNLIMKMPKKGMKLRTVRRKNYILQTF